MQLIFQLDIDDFSMMQQAVQRQLAVEPDTRTARRWLLFAVAAMTVVAVVIGRMKYGDQPRFAGFALLTALVAGIQLVRSYVASLNRNVHEYARPGVCGHHSIEVSELGIKDIHANGSQVMHWPAVVRIVRFQNMLVFVGNALIAIPLLRCSDPAGGAMSPAQIVEALQSLCSVPISNLDVAGGR